MKANDFSHFIERYNAGEMSDSEKLWFEKELEGNKSLRNEVEISKKTDEILLKQDVITLRNKLSSIEMDRKRSEIKKPQKQIFFSIAASVAVLVIVGSVLVLEGNNLSTNDIMKKYYEEYQPASGQRSVSSEKDDLFTQGLEYFQTHDYRNAALIFSKVIETEPKDMYATLLNGISNFEESRYLDAKKSFGTVIDDNKNLYIDQAQWYLALCYLQTDEKAKAIQLLHTISDEGGVYAKLSNKILRKIK
jgi:tetratricopeptide (TPR) repeat protein